MSSHDSIHDQAGTLGLEPLVRALAAPTQPSELVGREDALRAFRAEMLTGPRDRRQIWSLPMKPTVLRVRFSGGLAVVGAGLAAAAISFTAMAVPQFQNVSSDSALPVVTTTTSATDGTQTDGTQTDGTQTDGTQTDGTQTDGTQTDGTQTDGTQTSGTQTDGTQTDGTESTGTDSAGKGPDATGPAAFGLCTAWTAHQRNGAEPTGSIAFQNLATAAGGDAGIAAYCATVLQPTQAPTSTASSTDSATESPTESAAASPTQSTTGKGHGKGHGQSGSHGKGHAKHAKHAKHRH